jgi:hypothetical protein
VRREIGKSLAALESSLHVEPSRSIEAGRSPGLEAQTLHSAPPGRVDQMVEQPTTYALTAGGVGNEHRLQLSMRDIERPERPDGDRLTAAPQRQDFDLPAAQRVEIERVSESTSGIRQRPLGVGREQRPNARRRDRRVGVLSACRSSCGIGELPGILTRMPPSRTSMQAAGAGCFPSSALLARLGSNHL